MKKIAVLCTLAVFYSTTIFAQEYQISGKVVDNNNAPVSYATILLNTTNDEAIKGVASDDNGAFTITGLKEGTYKIVCSFVGFTTTTQEVSVTGDITVPPIVMQPSNENLEEVTVSAKKPTVKKLSDRIVFDVASTSLTNGSTWGVLEKTPQIILLNNQLTVKGQSPTVYINNKKVHLSSAELQQLLESTPATSIEAVEVITSPSAKYDAEDAIVVNIKMGKNLITGYNGNIGGNYTQGIYPKYALSTGHFYKTDKLNVYLSYGFNKKKLDRITSEYVQFYDNTQENGYWDSAIDLDTWQEDHTVTTNIDYELSAKSNLNFSANLLYNPYWERNTKSNTIAYDNFGVIDSTFNSFNNTRDNKTNIALNLGYTYAIDDEGQNLSVLLHHTNYDYERSQNVVTNYYDAAASLLNSNTINSLQNQDISITTGQVDYELPLPKSATLSFGAKGVTIDTGSDLLQEGVENGADNAYDFDYTETNIAGYTSFSKSFTKWSMRAGVRAEYTDAEGTAADATDNNSFDYLKWFPSASLSYDPADNHSFAFSYKRSINRPSYKRLNPFRYYLSDNSFVTGNSRLLPALKHYMNIDYTFKRAYTVSLFYKHISDPMSELSFQENETRKLKYVADNLEREESYGLDLYVSKPISNRWYLYFESSTFYNKLQFFAVENNNALVDNNRWTGWFFMGNYFTFLKDNSWLVDVTYMYVLPANDANAQVTARSNFSISMSKSLWNNRASLSLQANDIFNGQIFTSSTEYLNQSNAYRSRFENRTIMLGFKYKFGNYRLRNNKQDIDVEERERL
ncbi:TonB-dependent receptor domain-containing protein [Neptunitalea lumnitzerae]|uniref:TonB-dependent receptor n=1 Tax=Neptunitalea lumnitzerae TaxID=2965509 RepID=A0ABQ5MFW6_9FLAO|nr:outer membrane beta-barrel family protein [Neptunitalea sp. Y10]GLB48206.1 TonB-dependent receptor [Neptunitalea sp. Y10]